MRITLDLHLVINGTRTQKSGYFDIYKQSDIPQLAYDWIMRIRRGVRLLWESITYRKNNL
jgi:hypothetical protein